MPNPIFSIQQRVYFEDTDAAGIVYHSNYLRYMERARSEWIWSLGFCFDNLAEEYDVAFVVHHANIDWLYPARLKDHLTCTCTVSKMGRTSITFEQTVISRDDPDRIYAKADIRVVCVTLAGKVKPVPDKLKELMT